MFHLDSGKAKLVLRVPLLCYIARKEIRCLSAGKIRKLLTPAIQKKDPKKPLRAGAQKSWDGRQGHNYQSLALLR